MERVEGPKLAKEVLTPLIATLEGLVSQGVRWSVFNHAAPLITAEEKYQALRDNRGRVLDSLVANSVVHERKGQFVRFIISKSLTGKTQDGVHFIVTTFGLSRLSLPEKKEVLGILGQENVSGKKAKAILFGAGSGVDLDCLGQGAGYVGPFLAPGTGIQNIILQRPLFPEALHEETALPIADFALSNQTSLLLPYNNFPIVLRAYSEAIELPSPVFGLCVDRTVFTMREP